MAQRAPHLPTNGAVGNSDKDWVRTSFLLPIVPNSPTVGKLTQDDRDWLHYSSASLKFTSTGLGGNFAINPPPKFTRYADIPTGTWVQGVANSKAIAQNDALRDRGNVGGMGRFYSEAIDDNAFLIHMRFGRPEYKGLITFFTGFFDTEASRLAREGRGSNLAFLAGRLVGTVAGLGLFPVILLYKLGRILLSQPSTKYYVSRPTMPLYWNRVNMIAEKIGMSKGIIPKGKLLDRKEGEDFYAKHDMNVPGVSQDQMTHSQMLTEYEMLRTWRPQWFLGSSDWGGGLDIAAIVATPQVVAKETNERLETIAASCKTPQDIEKAIMAHLRSNAGYDKAVKISSTNKMLNEYFTSRFGSLDYAKPDPYTEEMKNRIGQARAEWGLEGGPVTDVTQTDAATGATPSPTAPAQTQAQQATAAANRANRAVSTGATGTTGIMSSGSLSNSFAGTPMPPLQSTPAPGTPATNTPAAGGTETPAIKPNGNFEVAKGSAASGTGANYGAGYNEYDEVAAKYASYDGQIFPVFIPTTDENTGEPDIVRSDPYINMEDLLKAFDNKKHQSAEWLILNVNAVDNVSESFNNNTSQSEIQNKINGLASANQAARFSLSDFNTGFGPIDAVIDTIKSTISGVASGLMLDGLVAMTGAGFVDIPERWDSASADVSSSATYTMQLRTPYGHRLSQFINIDIPIACMLAAALPISHGNQAYGEPFLVEMYIPGKNIIRLGIITSLSITRGVGNMGWSDEGTPLGVDITFTVKDLSTAVHAPIDTAMTSLKPWKGLMAADNTFHDYMAVLGNMSIQDMTTNWNRINMNIASKLNVYRRLVTPNSIMNNVLNNGVGRTILKVAQEHGLGNESIK